LGSVWAASEITLGSFLHNLRFPFSGHALTAIAVLLLSGAHRRWGGRGIVARAGLVAAMMKSASPSAVLLGPMVAIGMEGLSFELGLLIGRGGLIGCLIGGALAMSWTFLQLLLSLLLIYGSNLAEAYRKIVALAAEKMGPLPLGSAGPLAALALVSVSVGIAAALTGWHAGGRGDVLAGTSAGTSSLPARSFREAGRVTPRLPLLAVLLAALPLGIVGLSRVPLAAACAGTAAFLVVAGLRYRSALRRLLRPGFWAGLLTIAVGAALVLGYASGAPPAAALTIAAVMTLRAMFVTACFAAIGVELSNTALRASLGGHGGGALLGAADAAFATLPEVIASVPAARDLVTHPAAALASILPRLDALIEGLARPPGRAPAVIVTGERGTGKTTLATAAVERLRASGLRVGGVLAPGAFRDGKRFSFDVVDVASGARVPLACREPRPGWTDEGSFWVALEGLTLGRAALSAEGADVMVVDEVGPWELRGSGWSAELDALVQGDVPLLLTVRRECVPAAVSRWRLDGAVVFVVGEAQPERIAEALSAAARAGRAISVTASRSAPPPGCPTRTTSHRSSAPS
jgi:nucleoside-triphosphatase THEP1